jgi:hypothetical protein
MEVAKSWLPDKRSEVIEKAKVWHEVLTTPHEESVINAMAWNIPMDKIHELASRYDECVEYQHKTNAKTITTPEKALFKAAYEALKVVMRSLHAHFYLDGFPVDALAALGLRPRSKNNKPTPTPKSVPVIIEITPTRGRLMEFRFCDEHSPESERVPPNYDGAVLNFTWGPEKATDKRLIKERCLMPASPFLLRGLPLEAEGKWLSCYPQWQTHGEEGPDGDVSHSLIM